jgi:hypothetical protein
MPMIVIAMMTAANNHNAAIHTPPVMIHKTFSKSRMSGIAIAAFRGSRSRL